MEAGLWIVAAAGEYPSFSLQQTTLTKYMLKNINIYGI
jgi:hypothetical protein